MKDEGELIYGEFSLSENGKKDWGKRSKLINELEKILGCRTTYDRDTDMYGVMVLQWEEDLDDKLDSFFTEHLDDFENVDLCLHYLDIQHDGEWVWDREKKETSGRMDEVLEVREEGLAEKC